MTNPEGQGRAGSTVSRRLFVYNAGFLRQSRLRRILALDGWQMRLGRPTETDTIAVWGQSPYAHRGEAMAARTSARLMRVEDAFLRSLHPGRLGAPPLGLVLDHTGVHFDGRHPSDLETLLATHPLDDAALLARARGVIARMRDGHLSKYSATRTDIEPPAPGYVLVIDQTRNDASVTASGADRSRFLEMLTYARQEHPGARFVLKTHPETQAGLRDGHFQQSDENEQITLYDQPVSPWLLLEGAIAVYTVSSQMGFEAILAGHKPRVFGMPFYAGWGLTEDQDPIPRRQRTLTRAQLVAAAMILYPLWYDPHRDSLCSVEDVLGTLEAQSRAWREDRMGWVASGMRLWKRSHMQRFFGKDRRLVFRNNVDKAVARAAKDRRKHMVWGAQQGACGSHRAEDGFLRSRGLGADLVPPLSLVVDDLGLYYDPSTPSRLERLIAQHAALRPDQIRRIDTLISRILASNLSKYNLLGELPSLPEGDRILVPGQVEDDASIRLGTDDIATNAALLQATRTRNPNAVILYKPHPDVEAGLRAGYVANPLDWADAVLEQAPIAKILSQVSEVSTLTSLAGFEALLRGCRVTTYGAPFYAGWGLTTDLGSVPARRLAGARPDLNALAYATLIAYPRYFDPKTRLPCSVETAVLRLQDQALSRGGLTLRLLSKLQGAFATLGPFWR